VIEAEREAQKKVIEEKNRIELDALRKQREAEAQAKALKEISAAEAEAALKQAETLRTQAQAENEAEKLRADATRAKAAAAGLAEAEALSAKAEAGLREAEAIKARKLAEAEGEKAKAEALAAFDGVAQRVEIIKLELEAKVRIETARAQSMGEALSAMNIKLIGDPNSAQSLLRLMTMADGLGDVIRQAPQPVREVAQQVVNKVTGDSSGDALLRMAEEKVGTNGKGTGVAELALMLPKLVKIAEVVGVDSLKGMSVGQAMEALRKRVTDEGDIATLEKAQHALAMLPIISDMPFEDVYLRASAR
jgi:hypothetical protein